MILTKLIDPLPVSLAKFSNIGITGQIYIKLLVVQGTNWKKEVMGQTCPDLTETHPP